MAILKRAAFMVFSTKYIYYRPPTEKQTHAKRVLWANPNCEDILVDSCKPTLRNWKHGGPQPERYEDSVAWESGWLKEILRKKGPPAPAQLAAPSPPQSSTPGLGALFLAAGVPLGSARRQRSSLAKFFLCIIPGSYDWNFVCLLRYRDGNPFLARETLRDPIHCDTDNVSVGPTGMQLHPFMSRRSRKPFAG